MHPLLLRRHLPKGDVALPEVSPSRTSKTTPPSNSDDLQDATNAQMNTWLAKIRMVLKGHQACPNGHIGILQMFAAGLWANLKLLAGRLRL